jgi:hypothetical protein
VKADGEKESFVLLCDILCVLCGKKKREKEEEV